MATVEITLDQGESAPEVGDRVTITGEIVQVDPVVMRGTVEVSEDESMVGDVRRMQGRGRTPPPFPPQAEEAPTEEEEEE